MNLRIIIMLFFPFFAIAQAPQKINFQSILRNTNGEVVANKSVSLKISILSGSISGSAVYGETHTKTTDASGLISLQIGNGTTLSGVFANIAWGNSPHFIKLEADFSGGSNYVLLGTQELMSVPYALYASKTDTSALNLTSRLATKLTKTDTASLSNRIDLKLTKTDTASLSNRIDAKLTKTDTASLSNRIDAKPNLSDTSLLNLANRFSTKLNGTDTVSLSNRIDLKLTKTDTASLSNRIDAKPNLSDTSLLNLANRFSTKLNGTDTVSLSNRIDLKLTKTDTASLSNRIDAKAPLANPVFTGTVLGIDKTMVGLPNVNNTSDLNKPVSTATQDSLNLKLNRSDFPSGTNTGNILYWNGTSWVNLAPGQNGQALILVNGIPSWSGAAYSTLTTSSVSSITSTSVSGGGNISSDGGATVSARGLVYSTSTNPTLSNTVFTIGSGTGSFSETLTGLSQNTTYYIRAYATNSVGTAYGNEVSFTTLQTVTDIDGNTYNTVQIGNQVWMSENLKTTRYRNGGLITNAWSNSTTGAWSYYDNDETNNAIYGKLYNWYTTQGDTLCPTGWHVPNNTEWNTLTTYLGGVETAGTVMKDTSTLWNVAIIPSPGTNTSGFSALPGGYRNNDGSFNYINILAYFWSNTEHDSSLAWFRYLNENSGNVIRYYNNKSFGGAVRCLRD